MKFLKLETTNTSGAIEMSDIEEYAFGFKYLFIRFVGNNENSEGNTISIDRDTIKNAYRQYKDRWVKINMKSPKRKI